MSDYSGLSDEEKRQLISLDLDEIRQAVNGLVDTMINAGDTDYLIRIRALTTAITRQARPRDMALMMAISVDMLAQERTR